MDKNQNFLMNKVIAVRHDNGVITAFVHSVPGILVQGKTMDDVRTKLVAAIESYAKRISSIRNNFSIEEQNFA